MPEKCLRRPVNSVPEKSVDRALAANGQTEMKIAGVLANTLQCSLGAATENLQASRIIEAVRRSGQGGGPQKKVGHVAEAAAQAGDGFKQQCHAAGEQHHGQREEKKRRAELP